MIDPNSNPGELPEAKYLGPALGFYENLRHQGITPPADAKTPNLPSLDIPNDASNTFPPTEFTKMDVVVPPKPHVKTAVPLDQVLKDILKPGQ